MLKYTYDTALEEASRCLMCDDAPCMAGCPASVNPRTFIRKIRFGDLRGAVRTIRDANVLGGACAYICPCLSTCCSKCTHEKLTRPIDIAGLQRYVMDWERENGLIVPAKPKSNGKKVAVVGSGPAGLSCSARLASEGYDVTVFEAAAKIGGQLRLSIPEFRLPSSALDSDVEFIKKLGVKFKINTSVKDPSTLLKKFDSVFIAAGLMRGKKLGIKGEEKNGVVGALNYLIENKVCHSRAGGNPARLKGKRVLVIGGGDTAIDAARVARKAGAEVLMLYRRTQKDMPAYRVDIGEAFTEGVEMYFRIVPLEVLGKNKVEGLKVQRVSWAGAGRKAQGFRVEDEFTIKADIIINAIGQEKSAVTVKAGKSIFVGGDFMTGASTAVAAVADGVRAAEEMMRTKPLLCKEGQGEVEIYPTQPPSSARGGHGTKGRSYFPKSASDLSVSFCGVHFENPFILAAAPPSDELDMVRAAFKAGWAGAVLKTTSVEGTPVPLKYPMMSGIDYESQKLHAMGNIDLISEYHIDVIEKRVRILKKEFPAKVIIASIMGSKKEDWQTLVTRLSEAGADMIECSFSCPQGSLGAKPGQMLAQDVELTKTVAGWVKSAARAHKRNIPVVIKITPHVTDITDVARAVKDAGADAVCASNTIQSLMGIDLETWVPNPNVGGKSTYSGMSGPAVKPISLKVISEIAKKVGIPITGTGGPVTWSDAVEFMLAGAGTVQFCTAVMHYGYDIIDDLKSGVADYLEKKGLKKVSELVGRALPNIVTHEELIYKNKVVSKIDDKKCIRDDLCYIACRDGGHMAISLGKDRQPLVDEEKCVGCGLCRLICPVTGCIKMKKL